MFVPCSEYMVVNGLVSLIFDNNIGIKDTCSVKINK